MELKDLLGDSFHDGMTLEDVTEALKGIQMPTDQSGEIEKLRNSLSKSNSEAKEWKDKFRQTQDEATRTAAEAEENNKKMLEELENLRKERTISGYKASYLGLGYAEKDADEIATALAEGNTTKVLEVQKRHQDALVEKTKQELLKNTPRPGGTPGGDPDPEQNENVRIAKEMGKTSAGGAKTASDVLKNYMR